MPLDTEAVNSAVHVGHQNTYKHLQPKPMKFTSDFRNAEKRNSFKFVFSVFVVVRTEIYQ